MTAFYLQMILPCEWSWPQYFIDSLNNAGLNNSFS